MEKLNIKDSRGHLPSNIIKLYLGLSTIVGLKELDSSSCPGEAYISLETPHVEIKEPHESGCGQELNWMAQLLAALRLQRRKGKSCVDRKSREGSGRGTWKPGPVR